jgi:hypothetical protein
MLPPKNRRGAPRSAPTQVDEQLRREDSITLSLRQAEAATAELRARGCAFAMFALSFDEEREKLREEIEALVREKALERRRQQLELWENNARLLAYEFADKGDWQTFKTLLWHVAAMKQALERNDQRALERGGIE